MKKLFIMISCALCLCACSAEKPPLEQTQIVNGKSIVMPPDFYVLPKTKTTDSQLTPTEE